MLEKAMEMGLKAPHQGNSVLFDKLEGPSRIEGFHKDDRTPTDMWPKKSVHTAPDVEERSESQDHIPLREPEGGHRDVIGDPQAAALGSHGSFGEGSCARSI